MNGPNIQTEYEARVRLGRELEAARFERAAEALPEDISKAYQFWFLREAPVKLTDNPGMVGLTAFKAGWDARGKEIHSGQDAGQHGR